MVQWLCLFFFFSSRRRHTRSLCDWSSDVCSSDLCAARAIAGAARCGSAHPSVGRSEEHTSELQSHSDLVCRLLLEKKKNTKKNEHLQQKTKKTKNKQKKNKKT